MRKDGKLFKTAKVGDWLDSGTLPAWLDKTSEILKKENHSHPEFQNTILHKPVFIAEGVTLSDIEIGTNVGIEKGAVITNSQIKNSITREDTPIANSTLDNSTIGKSAECAAARWEIHLSDH